MWQLSSQENKGEGKRILRLWMHEVGVDYKESRMMR